MNTTVNLSTNERIDEFARRYAAILRRMVSEQKYGQETHKTTVMGACHAAAAH